MRRARTEAGFTLIELMVAMVISIAIVLPLMAWADIGFGQQRVITTQSHDDEGANFLGIALPRDVASASDAQPGGRDCTDNAPTGPAAPANTPTAPAPPRTVVLTLDYSGAANIASRTEYVVDDLPSGGVLRRRTCDASGYTTSDNVLEDDLVKPTGGWASSVTCASRAGYGNDPCGQVKLSVTGLSAKPYTVTADLRTGPFR